MQFVKKTQNKPCSTSTRSDKGITTLQTKRSANANEKRKKFVTL